MTIVTQSSDNHKCEYSPDLVAEVTHEETSGSGYKRTLEYREWRNRVAAAMFDAGLADESVAFLHCAEIPRSHIPSNTLNLPGNAETVWVCDHAHHHDALLFFATCGNRGCPDCAHRQVARFAHRYVPAVLAAAEKRGQNRLRHIVLTTPISLHDENLKQEVSEKWKAIGRLWKSLTSRSEKYTTEGTIEAFEFGEQGHKLHFHIIHYGRYLPQSVISEVWSELTGGECEVTYVCGIGSGVDATDEEIANDVIETLKYSVKFWSKDRDGNIVYIEPELMPLLIGCLKGKRRVRSRGCFYNIKEPDLEPLACVTCGAPMLRVGVVFFPIWQATGFSPAEYKAALDGDRLQFILANKSVKDGSEGNKSPPVQAELWPELDVSGQFGQSHYDYVPNRKAL